METFFPAQKWNTLKCIDKLYNDSNDGINGMLNLFVLLYADDTVIMAENEHDMQRNLELPGYLVLRFLGSFLQTAQIWANAGVVLELVSPLQVTHLPPVWDLLLPLA